MSDLRAAGVDLTDYNSVANAHDLEDLRVALGIAQWNLIGGSYGGRLALVTMREHPESVRAAVLDSVYDVSYGGLASRLEAADRAFAALVDACQASEPCADRGDLAEMIERVRLSFNESPIETTVELEGEPTEFVITGDDVIAFLFLSMYSTQLLPGLPGVVAQLDGGVTASVSQVIPYGVRFATSLATVMTVVVDCADNAGLERDELDAQASDDPGPYSTIALGFTECPPDWPATSATFNKPVASDIPSLLFAGGFDPVTPRELTLALAEHLANSTSVFVPAGGHGTYGECPQSIMAEFFDDPTSPPDASCVDELDQLAPR